MKKDVIQEFNATRTNACLVCGNPTARISGSRYRQTCCREHFKLLKQKTNSTTQQKRKLTTLHKYGVDHISKLSEVKEQKIQTSIEHYGTEHPLQNRDVLDKVAATSLERYGESRATKAAEYRKQIGDANKKIAKEAKRKRVHTMLEKYGVEHNSYMTAVKNQRALTKIKNFGDNFGSEIYTRTAEKFGGIHPIQLAEQPFYTKSKGETEVINALKDLGLKNIEHSNRTLLKGKEIDVWLPDFSLGIEFNGVYWHSEAAGCMKGEMYQKYQACKELGIKLINVWETEWYLRNSQVVDFLAAQTNCCNVIYARKGKVNRIDSESARNFINQYHIQTTQVRPKIAYGFFYENELMAVMSFGVHHRNSTQWVLNRFCCKSRTRIQGVASKLLDHARKENQELSNIVSWSDNRWSEGNLYTKLGFEKSEVLPPDYSYYDSHSGLIKSKQSCTKKKLHAVDNQTEVQKAVELGMYRIWDCGKIRWQLKSDAP